ncbi:MAG: hypothetical protein EXS36_20005 [Pedosphaera sp.]|nr:hypothetical protein [Pedosphaera sp.]
MGTLNLPQKDATGDNLEERQVNDKTGKAPKARRVRSAEGTLAYWKGKLFRNSYIDRKGRKIEIPEFYVRMRYEGVTKRVKLHSADKEEAAEQALRLSGQLRLNGWSAVLANQARLPSSLTIEDFCEAYEKAAASMERSPRPVTINLYCRCLRLIARFAGVKEIRQLTRETIERGRDAYRAEARKSKRQESAIQNTVSKVLRNAKACFSREARNILARDGVKVENPFEGIRLTQDIQPVFSLPAHVTQTIWDELPLLRDGDPDAIDPNAKPAKRGKKSALVKARSAASRIDFRQRHPASYAAIVLALGVGLRANEIDKCRWSWFKFNAKKECVVEIRAESDFTPKGGGARAIKIQNSVYDALVETRADMVSPYVLGGEENPADSIINGENYRCADALEAANVWLRARGVEADKKRGNALHRLRKQFGSEVATEFGLFAAQKLLGHSSPTVTAKYYAAQTELPTLTHVRIMG